jgi:hypothetical protein
MFARLMVQSSSAVFEMAELLTLVNHKEPSINLERFWAKYFYAVITRKYFVLISITTILRFLGRIQKPKTHAPSITCINPTVLIIITSCDRKK